MVSYSPIQLLIRAKMISFFHGLGFYFDLIGQRSTTSETYFENTGFCKPGENVCSRLNEQGQRLRSLSPLRRMILEDEILKMFEGKAAMAGTIE